MSRHESNVALCIHAPRMASWSPLDRRSRCSLTAPWQTRRRHRRPHVGLWCVRVHALHAQPRTHGFGFATNETYGNVPASREAHMVSLKKTSAVLNFTMAPYAVLSHLSVALWSSNECPPAPGTAQATSCVVIVVHERYREARWCDSSRLSAMSIGT